MFIIPKISLTMYSYNCIVCNDLVINTEIRSYILTLVYMAG